MRRTHATRAAQARTYLEYLSLFEDELALPRPVPDVSERRVLQGCLNPLPDSLRAFEQSICACLRCPLGATRTKFVFGDGDPHSRIVFVGEAPGQDEDLQGIPFVGRAGQLLNNLLGRVGLHRADVYICNVVKCRPPNNREPEPEEEASCRPYLMTQLSLINPDIIVCLGRHAAEALLHTDAPMKELRGRLIPWQNMQVLVTYHPAYFLRNQSQLSTGEQDFRLLKKLYDELPARRHGAV